MTEYTEQRGISNAAAKIIAAVIGAVAGIVIALISVGFFPALNPGLETLKEQNAELQAQLAQTIPAPKDSDVWTDQNGVKRRYWVFKGFPEWEKAETFCENLGGHLATITSVEEQAHIEEYVKKNIPRTTCVWIGIQRNNGLWNQWVSGEQFEYANWAPSYPGVNVELDHAAFSNYESIWISSAKENATPGQWLLLDGNSDEDVKLNADGWLICEWDYD